MKGDKVGKHYEYCTCLYCLGLNNKGKKSKRAFNKKKRRKAIRLSEKKMIEESK